MKEKIRLSILLPISFLLVSLTMGVGAGLSSYNDFDKTLTRHVHSHLKTAVQSKTGHIKTFLEMMKMRAVDFSSDGAIKKSLADLKNGGDFERISEELEQHIMISKIIIDKDIYEIYVLDEVGNKVAESVAVKYEEEHAESGEEGSFSKDPLYLEGRKNPYVKKIFYDSEFTRFGMAFSAPILLNEELLGVIIIKMTPGTLSEITTEREGLGETGEVYVINDKKELISESRFLKGKNKGVLTQVVDTENSEKCLLDMEEKIYEAEPHDYQNDPIKFLDYRGEIVLGAHDVVPEMNWCVLAEIDEAEALGTPKNNFLKSTLIILITISTAFAILGFVAGKRLDARYLLVKSRNFNEK